MQDQAQGAVRPPRVVAVVLVKDVDPRVLEAPGRLFTVEDVSRIAVQLHELAEYDAADPRQRDRHDYPLRRWGEIGPERQWAFWHRAAEAVEQAEAQRRVARAPVLDRADPARGVAGADAA